MYSTIFTFQSSLDLFIVKEKLYYGDHNYGDDCDDDCDGDRDGDSDDDHDDDRDDDHDDDRDGDQTVDIEPC